MHISNFKQLLAQTESMGRVTTTAIESFYFRCRLLGCTRKTQSVYAERLGYLLRYAKSVGSKLERLTKHDLQRYIVSLLKRSYSNIVESISFSIVADGVRIYFTVPGNS